MTRVAPFVLLVALSACATSPPAQNPRAEGPLARAEEGRQWCAYVTGFGSDQVCGLRVPSAESIGCVRTGDKPHGIALAQDGSRLYVSSEGTNTVSVVDAGEMRVIATVPVGQRPNQVALTPDGRTLWVTNNADHSVSIVDTSTNGVTRTLEVGRNPHIVVINPSRRQALVTSEGDGAVDVFNVDTLERDRRIDVYGFPRVPTVTPHGDRAFLTLRWLDGALVLDLEAGAVTDRIAVGYRPFAEAGMVAHGVAATHDGRVILLTTQTSGQLTWIDASNLSASASVRVGASPNWVEVTPDDRFAVVSNTAEDTAVVVDVQRQTIVGRASVSAKPKRLTVGVCPQGSAISEGGQSR